MSRTAFEILGVVVLIIVNAFFVIAEFAIVKVRDTRIAELAAEGSRRARVADHILKNLAAYLSATQLGVTAASLGLGWLGAVAFGDLFELAVSPGLGSGHRLRAHHVHHHHLRRAGAQVAGHPQGRPVDAGDLHPAALVLPDHPAGHLAAVHQHRGHPQAVPHRAGVGERPGPLRGRAPHDPGGQPGGRAHRRGGAGPHAPRAHVRRPDGQRHHGAPHRDGLPAHIEDGGRSHRRDRGHQPHPLPGVRRGCRQHRRLHPRQGPVPGGPQQHAPPAAAAHRVHRGDGQHRGGAAALPEHADPARHRGGRARGHGRHRHHPGRGRGAHRRGAGRVRPRSPAHRTAARRQLLGGRQHPRGLPRGRAGPAPAGRGLPHAGRPGVRAVAAPAPRGRRSAAGRLPCQGHRGRRHAHLPGAAHPQRKRRKTRPRAPTGPGRPTTPPTAAGPPTAGRTDGAHRHPDPPRFRRPAGEHRQHGPRGGHPPALSASGGRGAGLLRGADAALGDAQRVLPQLPQRGSAHRRVPDHPAPQLELLRAF